MRKKDLMLLVISAVDDGGGNSDCDGGMQTKFSKLYLYWEWWVGGWVNAKVEVMVSNYVKYVWFIPHLL